MTVQDDIEERMSRILQEKYGINLMDKPVIMVEKMEKEIKRWEDIEQWVEGAAAFFVGDKTWPISSYIHTAKNLGLIK